MINRMLLFLQIKIIKGLRGMLEFTRKMLWSLTDNMEKSTDGIWFKIYYGIMTIPIVIVYVPLYIIRKTFLGIK